MAIATPSTIGGYDYSFVDKPHDRYICKTCHLPSKEPYLSECCGHLFCKSCLDNIKKAAAISNACPICRDEEFKTFRNKAIDREIRELQVYCTNEEKGCEWQGELNYINNHLGNSDGCQFEEVKCSNECGKMIERRYLTSHVETECPHRKVNCQYCHDTGEHQFIEGRHKEECPKLPLPCPNNCEVGSVPREDMEAHRKECPLEMIQCEYHNVGCEVRMARKDWEKHENKKMKEHLMMTKSKLNEELTDTKSQLAIALKQITSLTILMHSQLNPSADVSSVSAAKWSFNLEAMALMFKSGNQVLPVVAKMSGYNKMLENQVRWYSDPFNAHKNGYRMCLSIDTAGAAEGVGTHLSVYLCLMKGSHDDELTWPLREKFEIKLLNQISDSVHHSVTFTYDKAPGKCKSKVIQDDRATGWGKPQFISNENLHKTSTTCQYLKHDSLFFKVTKL